MQKEYKNALEKIQLSESDKERILANVKEAYANSSEKVVSMNRRPHFSARQWGMIAAAFVFVIVSAVVVRSQFLGGENGMGENDPLHQVTRADVWEELDSIEAIAEETECRTYTLDELPKSYEVKKVEVEKTHKHVKITYQNKKKKDSILLEYKEEENASAVTSKFEEKNELTKEKVGDSEVTLYGDEECEGMTWQKESCTFALVLEEACSKEKAVKLVSGTKERKRDGAHEKEDKDKKKVSNSAVGWNGGEKASTEKQQRKILKKIYKLYGFRVTIQEPATKVSYKIVDGFESFSFCYPEVEELENRRVVGYAGEEGTPKGVLKGFEESEEITVNGNTVQVYANAIGEEIYTFEMKGISFALLTGDILIGDKETLLSELMSVIRISFHSGKAEGEEEETTEENTEDDEEETEEGTDVSEYRDMAQRIQYAVADGSLKKLSSYMEFPLTITGLDVTVSSASEFENMDASTIFTSDWVDSVVSYDINDIGEDTESFVMGNSSNAIVCKIKNNSVVITELRMSDEDAESEAMPLEE